MRGMVSPKQPILPDFAVAIYRAIPYPRLDLLLLAIALPYLAKAQPAFWPPWFVR